MPDGSVVEVEYHSKPIIGKLRQRRRIAAHESRFLAAHAESLFKITLPSPNVIGAVPGESDVPPVYASRDELLADLIPIYQAELRALASDVVPYIQLDQTIGRFSTAQARDALVAAGEDPAAAIAREVAADNACLDAIATTGVTTAKHFCRGSRTRSRGEGDYEWFGEHVFPELHVDRFLLEYDSDIVGGFEPLRFIPKGKVAVLGLVTSKYPDLESQDELLRRIEEASRFCPVEQLAISPQCGFGGSAENNFMSVDEQWRKLENMVAVATRVWG
jgi:5-methyltetrahydropteroyltriglutamate--homocysteine methyltransferase